jgi:phosphoenolpyruvate carboxykinase (ATP)
MHIPTAAVTSGADAPHLDPDLIPAVRSLESMGLNNLEAVHWNDGASQLIEYAIQRNEGVLSDGGSLVVRTGQFTGRSPKDKYIVRDAATSASVDWGAVNQPMPPAQFERLRSKVMTFLQGNELFVSDLRAGADHEYGITVRAITQYAWHSLFARQLLIRSDPGAAPIEKPDFTLIFAPEFLANPAEDGTHSETCIALDFSSRTILIVGTSYAGELKKSIFTALNYLLPERGVMPMHCSANQDKSGSVALFFGLSGTGKTTLSADPERELIGDDEHGWSDRGVFNFEGGCYAKCIHLSAEKEPQIWGAIRYGTVLENVVMDPVTRQLDFNSDAYTENTRAAYPLEFIENALIPSTAGHPRHAIFLTADAFGVLPPIAKLDADEAMYQFLNGYTAKIAGTERGLSKEPQATFSTCFGAPFMPRRPRVYAELLGEKLRALGVRCWLVNTGWVGGAYGVGERISLRYTRALLQALLSGELETVATRREPVLGLRTPVECPGVPAEILDARGMWPDAAAYDEAAANLRQRFEANYRKFE